MKSTSRVLALLTAVMPFSFADPLSPEPVSDPLWLKTIANHRGQLAAASPADIIFVGDSITEGWGHAGADVFALDFHHWRTLNFGIGGDRTEHILQRVGRYDFSRAKPRLFVVLAGTNNLGKMPSDDPETVAAAVIAISDRLKRKCPTAKTLIISILPSGKAEKRELRKRIKIANTALAASLSESETAYLDIHNLFLDSDGRWKPGLSFDGTHLTKSGYDVFARALRPEIERLLSVSDQKSSPS